MGICCPNDSINKESNTTNYNPPINSLSSNYTIRNNFPKGTIYEKELNLNFK